MNDTHETPETRAGSSAEVAGYAAGDRVRLIGFGANRGEMYAECIKTTKTQVVVRWGAGEARFGKRDGEMVGAGFGYSGWRMAV